MLSSVSVWRVHGTDASSSVSWQSLILSILFSMTLAALLSAAVGTLVWGACSRVSVLRAASRKWAAVATTAVLSAYVALRGAAEAFHLSSGAPLNLGTLEFVAAGWSHLLTPVLVEYAPVAVGLGGVIVICCISAFVYLSRSLEGVAGDVQLLVRGGGSFVGLLGLLQVLTTPGMTVGCGLNQTADLTLLTSIAARRAQLDDLEDHAGQTGIIVSPGAPLSTGELWASAAPNMEGPRPNVILVMMESVGVSHLGSFGYERNVTPHLDRIAQKSVRFGSARSTAAHSNYAQMAVLSSLFPRRFSGLDTYERLDYPRFLWHDFLATLGYATATYSSQDETWQGMLTFQETGTPTHFHHSATYEGKRLRMGSEEIVPDEVTIRRAIEWIGAREGPFGLYVNLQSTHFPYRVPEGAPRPFLPDRPARGRYHYLHYPKSDLPAVINRYDNALSYVDAQIGRLYDYLEATGRLDDTVLVITSDHGELFWDHGMVTHGRSLYEAEVRVPLFVHFPSGLTPRDVRRPVSTLDVLPTLATLLDVPPHPAFQGTSLLQQADPDRPLFMNIQGMKSHDAVICGHYKLIVDRGTRKQMLFHLEEDPGETRDISARRPAVTRALRSLLSAQMRAQLRYHSPREASERQKRYAPRFASCPDVTKAPGIDVQREDALSSRSDVETVRVF